MGTIPQALFKPYRVGEAQITAVQIYSALSRINTASAFQHCDLRFALGRAGVEQNALDRAADRLLQRCRKMGLVAFKHAHWWTRSELSEAMEQFFFPAHAQNEGS